MLIKSKIKENKNIILICLVGLILRTVFTLFIAKNFYDCDNIYVVGDTFSWLISFVNLLNDGSFTINPANEYGYFFRMPGYSFFMGIFYFVTGKNYEIMFPAIGWFQIFLDCFSVFLIYKITFSVLKTEKVALIAGLLYSTYPFIIVSNPTVSSESVSVFLMLLGLYLFLQGKTKNAFWSGIAIGIGILFRPQLIFFIPILGILTIYYSRKLFNKSLFAFFIAIILSYGIWPIRNIVFHKKVILTQDLRGAKNWNKDVLSFMQYIYSVKNDWEPQFSSILNNNMIKWPKESHLSEMDSIVLEKTGKLCKNCGSGFSHWKGYWKKPFFENDCNDLIEKSFNALRKRQVKNNPWNFYIIVPLQNFKKAILKSTLINKSNLVRLIASNLFYIRTILIFIGIFGLLKMIIRKKVEGYLFLFFFIFVYFTLCFGTLPQMRNIEIRYFLHADILLLIPGSYFINEVIFLFRKKY